MRRKRSQDIHPVRQRSALKAKRDALKVVLFASSLAIRLDPKNVCGDRLRHFACRSDTIADRDSPIVQFTEEQ